MGRGSRATGKETADAIDLEGPEGIDHSRGRKRLREWSPNDTFRDGKRLREWSPKDLLPLIPEHKGGEMAPEGMFKSGKRLRGSSPNEMSREGKRVREWSPADLVPSPGRPIPQDRTPQTPMQRWLAACGPRQLPTTRRSPTTKEESPNPFNIQDYLDSWPDMFTRSWQPDDDNDAFLDPWNIE
ncbi:hypothetical protein B0T24DRAFT_586914 [Lasiosphaeria ovina]|uniref:Uncharacterized protein n=1 Tax=Lasiosphaeria ovina TaxID=92902 RepID=A0AAE0NIH6_9PEZI|nr:hypothetical protein B0T24DRAFT_586914 [Lasiosphaeria ovina]